MSKEGFKKEMLNMRQALTTGVSYMLPVVVAGGILLALGITIGGVNVSKIEGTFAHEVFNWGLLAFEVMIPVLGAYVSFSIADKPGLAPGFVAGMIANQQGSGFLGSLVGGIVAGYLVVFLIKIIKLPPKLRPVLPSLILPVLGTFFTGLFMTFVLGTPITWLNDNLMGFLEGMSGTSSIILGLIQGSMLAFDMGGPFNKIAYSFAIAASSDGNWAPMAANNLASITPPMGMAMALLMGKKIFSASDRSQIGGCVVGGVCQITEFCIPFAVKNPLRTIPCFMIGSGVGASLCYAFDLTLTSPHGGALVFFLANKPFIWLGIYLFASFLTAVLILLTHRNLNTEELSVGQV